MAEEMMLESVPLESDEAEDSESEEDILEAEESAEDIGERAPWRRRRRARKSYYRPGRGVRGIALRSPDGRVRNVPFPAKLATAAETNRGLATQEVARRALDERLDRLETRFRAQQRRDSAASGLVTLVVGGGLAAWGAFEAGKRSEGFSMASWAGEQSTKMAALASVSQIATSGAKLAINGHYHRSGFGVAADAFAATQLAAFAFASLYTPPALEEVDDSSATNAASRFRIGARVYDKKTAKIYQVIGTRSGEKYFLPA